MMDDRFLTLLDRLKKYMLAQVDNVLAAGHEVIMFGDDWGVQNGPIMALEQFREVFVPHYRGLFAAVKKAGRRIFFHSCGSLGPILDELICLGIDGLWHQVNRYDEAELADKCKANGVTVFIHPDRQRLVPMGTPVEIRQAVKRYADRYHRLGGGGIFYVEIENDAPFSNVKALIEAIEEFR
jgi:uroporphyrinogen decarboxylase